MRPSDDARARLERLLEVGVYAPVGFLVTQSKTVPELAKAGRKQIAFARSLGQAAIKTLVRSVRSDEPDALDPEPLDSVADDPAPEGVAGGDMVGPEAGESAAPSVAPVSAADDVDAPDSPSEPPTSASPPTPEPQPDIDLDGAPSGADSAEIEGYDDLTAREIIEILRTAGPRRGRWVHDRESAQKGRVTVLRAALRAAEQ